MAIIYEVNLNVDTEISEEYKHWLVEHIETMLNFEGFEKANLYHDSQSTNETNQFIVQYQLKDRACLDLYLNQHAAKMRAEGEARFNKRFTASRRVYDLLRTFKEA